MSVWDEAEKKYTKERTGGVSVWDRASYRYNDMTQTEQSSLIVGGPGAFIPRPGITEPAITVNTFQDLQFGPLDVMGAGGRAKLANTMYFAREFGAEAEAIPAISKLQDTLIRLNWGQDMSAEQVQKKIREMNEYRRAKKDADGIVARPLTTAEIAAEEAIDKQHEVNVLFTEHPELLEEMKKKAEDELITEYITEHPEHAHLAVEKEYIGDKKPSSLQQSWMSVIQGDFLTESQPYKVRRKWLIKKAVENRLEKSLAKGLTMPRRQYGGFFDELTRASLQSMTMIGGGLMQELSMASEYAIWDKAQVERMAAQLHEISRLPSLQPAEGATGFILSSVTNAGSFMGASLIATMITGTPYAAFGVAYAVEGNEAYNNAIAAGATEEQAMMEKFVVGTLNGAIEQLQFNRILTFAKSGKNSLRSVLKAARAGAIRKMTKMGGELTYEMAVHFLAESLEEASQEIVSMTAPAIHGRELPSAKEYLVRVPMAALGGGIAGLIFGGGGRILAGPQQQGFESGLADAVARDTGLSRKSARGLVKDTLKTVAETKDPEVLAKMKAVEQATLIRSALMEQLKQDKYVAEMKEKQDEERLLQEAETEIERMDREVEEIQRAAMEEAPAEEAIAEPTPTPKPLKPAEAPEIAPKAVEGEVAEVKITNAHKELQEEAMLVSEWGNAEDFANQIIEKEKLKDERYKEMLISGRGTFAYGMEPIHFLDGLDLTSKEELIDFYNQTVRPTKTEPEGVVEITDVRGQISEKAISEPAVEPSKLLEVTEEAPYEDDAIVFSPKNIEDWHKWNEDQGEQSKYPDDLRSEAIEYLADQSARTQKLEDEMMALEEKGETFATSDRLVEIQDELEDMYDRYVRMVTPEEDVVEPGPAKPVKRDLFGQPIFEPITGEQGDLGIGKGELAERKVDIKPELADAVGQLLSEKKPPKTAKEAYTQLLPQRELFTAGDVHNQLKEVEEAWSQATLGKPIFTEEHIDEKEATGISDKVRNRLVRAVEKRIADSEVYQIILDGLESTPIGLGYYYVDKGFKGEVEAIIGRPRKGAKTRLQRMFTYDPNTKIIIKGRDGKKAEIGPTHWQSAVQEALGRGKQGIDETAGEMDISDFVQLVKDAMDLEEAQGTLNAKAVAEIEKVEDPELQMLLEKRYMLTNGSTVDEINAMVREWGERYGVDEDTLFTELIGEEREKLGKIRRIKDEGEVDRQLDLWAEENVRRQMRAEASESVQDILKKNGLEKEVQEVEEIDLPEKPVDDVPFERRKIRTGALVTTQAGKEIILLAYGADSETGYHEGYHVLRKRLTDGDIAILDDRFANEEREAEAFAEYAKTSQTPHGMAQAIWDKLVRFLQRIKSALQGRGLRTAGDIFADIKAGEITTVELTGETVVRFETSGESMRREAEFRARVRAEKARLKAIAKPKQPRLRARIKIKIDEMATPFLRDDLAPAELPAERIAEPGEEVKKGVPNPALTQAWFDENIDDETRSTYDRFSRGLKDTARFIEKFIASSSTRLYNIHPELFRRVRRYAADYMRRNADLLTDIEPFLNMTKKMSRRDQKQLDKAFKNGTSWKVDELIFSYDASSLPGVRKAYEAARDVLDEIFDAAEEVGIDIDYRKAYWPREIKDVSGFLDYWYQTEDWSIIQQAIKNRAEKAGRDIAELTDEEKAQVINTLLRGYRTGAVALATPGAAKERLVPEVNSDINQFYYDFRTSVTRYIRKMNEAIAQREFFGKETKEITKLRGKQSARLTRLLKLKRRRGLKKGTTEKRYKEHISKTAEAWKADHERLQRIRTRDLTETIGGYVAKLVDSGHIQPLQEQQIKDILEGIFRPGQPGKPIGIARTAIFFDTLGSTVQAITQLAEFGYAFYRSPYHALPAAIRTIARRSKFTLKDIGVFEPGHEFREANMQKGLSALLMATGFYGIDVFGKESYMNTVYSKYRAAAQREIKPAWLIERLQRVFGENYKQVVEDMRAGIKSDDVRYMMFNELADIQPIAITEMPEMYNRSANGRIFYTLKTFYMKRLDFIRNECFRDMARPETFLRGFSRLIWLALSLGMFEAGSDFLKDWLRGRKFSLSDSVIDNMLRFVFFSKYQAWKMRGEGLGTAFLEGWRPPTKFLDAITKDIFTIAEGKDRGFELWRSLPQGELYYWWWGRGFEKTEAAEQNETVTISSKR